MKGEKQMKIQPIEPLLWHCNDPNAAIQAARRHETKAATNATIVFAAVLDNPESTAAELGEITKLGHIETQRRLSDLTRKGKISKRSARKCSVKNTNMTTWIVVLEYKQRSF